MVCFALKFEKRVVSVLFGQVTIEYRKVIPAICKGQLVTERERERERERESDRE